MVGKLASKQHCIQSFISKDNAGEASVGVADLPGASVCKVWQERREQRAITHLKKLISTGYPVEISFFR